MKIRPETILHNPRMQGQHKFGTLSEFLLDFSKYCVSKFNKFFEPPVQKNLPCGSKKKKFCRKNVL